MGGLFITSGERDILYQVLHEGRDAVQLPCRIREVAAFFCTACDPTEKLVSEEMFNIFRVGLGLPLEQLKNMRECFYARTEEEGKPIPVYQFSEYIMQNAQVKEEQFILDKCFALPYC